MKLPLLSKERLPGLLVPHVCFRQSLALLVMRVSFGLALWFSGYSHLHNYDMMVKRFTDWGVPLPGLNVYISGCTEAGGGLLLLFGIATRLISIPLFFNFIVAYVTASRNKLVQMIAGPGHWEGVADVVNDDAMPFLVMSLIAMAFGPGKISVDYIIKRILVGPSSRNPH
jgi:putative oxidoreductase